MGQHPDDLKLEALRTGEAEPEISHHVEQCEACQRRRVLLEELEKSLGHHERVEIPKAIDDRILAVARERATLVRRPKHATRILRWTVPAAAAAAALLLVARPLVDEERAGQVGLAADVNRDGRVNIVDALVLARAIEHNETEIRWDVNGDQRVDDLDVERVASGVVLLAGGWR